MHLKEENFSISCSNKNGTPAGCRLLQWSYLGVVHLFLCVGRVFLFGGANLSVKHDNFN